MELEPERAVAQVDLRATHGEHRVMVGGVEARGTLSELVGRGRELSARGAHAARWWRRRWWRRSRWGRCRRRWRGREDRRRGGVRGRRVARAGRAVDRRTLRAVWEERARAGVGGRGDEVALGTELVQTVTAAGGDRQFLVPLHRAQERGTLSALVLGELVVTLALGAASSRRARAARHHHRASVLLAGFGFGVRARSRRRLARARARARAV